MLIDLPTIISFFDDCAEQGDDLSVAIADPKNKLLESIKDLRCWVKHFYD